MNHEHLLNDFIDGALDYREEVTLFSELSVNDALRHDLRTLMLVQRAVGNDVAAYSPPPSSTTAIYRRLGFADRGPAPVPAGSVVRTLHTIAGGIVGALLMLAVLVWQPSLLVDEQRQHPAGAAIASRTADIRTASTHDARGVANASSGMSGIDDGDSSETGRAFAEPEPVELTRSHGNGIMQAGAFDRSSAWQQRGGASGNHGGTRNHALASIGAASARHASTQASVHDASSPASVHDASSPASVHDASSPASALDRAPRNGARVDGSIALDSNDARHVSQSQDRSTRAAKDPVLPLRSTAPRLVALHDPDAPALLEPGEAMPTPISPIVIDKLPIAFEIRSLVARDVDRVPAALAADASTLLRDAALALQYRVGDHDVVAVEVGQESYYQRFTEDRASGDLVQHEQRPLLPWTTVAYRRQLYPSTAFNTFAQIALGATQVGPMARVMAGGFYEILPELRITAGIEASAVAFPADGSWYVSPKYGITYGLSVNF